MKLEHRGHAFELSASGAIRWDTTLLVADLHLGKETVFQKSGLAIPSGATQATLQRLQTQIHEMGIKRLVVLGDLLHAAIGWTDALESMLGQTMQAASGVQWELVAGNHDRRSHQRLRRLGWIVQEPPVFDGNMRWLHDPDSPDSPVSANPASEDRTYQTTLCGHLHPSYIVPIDAKRTAKVPCFWIRPDSIVLPAYGGWVGTHAIQPRLQDRVLLCVEGDLIEWKHHGPNRTTG